MIIIRSMIEADLEQVCLIEEETFSVPWSRSAFLEMISCDWALYMVAEENQQILGSCGVRNIAGDGEITNVVIKKEFRGQGIGKMMVQELLEQGLNMGITAYTLEVRAGNQTAIAMYEKLGFSTEGRRKNFYEKPREDALIMWKH